MDKLSTNKVMTTKEVAAALCLKDNSSVTRVAKKCLPDKVIEKGKTTFWTEEELTVLLHFVQNHQSDRADLTSAYLSRSSTETALSKEVWEACYELDNAPWF